MDHFIINELLTIRSINPDGKKFDKISRCVATNDDLEIEVVFDYHDQLLKISESSIVDLVVAKELRDRSIVEKYDYATYGTVYSFESTSLKDIACISFGGMLSKLTTRNGLMSDISIGNRVYLMIKNK